MRLVLTSYMCKVHFVSAHAFLVFIWPKNIPTHVPIRYSLAKLIEMIEY